MLLTAFKVQETQYIIFENIKKENTPKTYLKHWQYMNNMK